MPGQKCESLWREERPWEVCFGTNSHVFSSEMRGEVAFGCENYGLSHEEIVFRTDSAIERFKLENLCERPLDVLSSGEKQRTAVASVYAMNPAVYVFDEPTANLDRRGIGELKNAIGSLKRDGKTLLIAEHRLSYLTELADRFVYVRNGRILWERTPEQMFELGLDELKTLELRTVRELEPVRLSRPEGDDGSNWAISLRGLGCRRRKYKIWDDLHFKGGPVRSSHNG